MQVIVEGIDGEVGSMYLWEGDPDITGKGQMTNTGMNELEQMRYKINFVAPGENETKGYVRVQDLNGTSEATWAFYGENSFPGNIFMLFLNMDREVGEDFEKGLTLLKSISEKQAEQIEQYDVKKKLYLKPRIML